MKFKVLPGTELFKKLTEVQERVEAGRSLIKKTLIEKGYSGQYAQSSSSYLLKVDAIEIDGDKPKGWKVVDKYQRLYFPLASNKKDILWINDLPSVSNDELNNLLKFSFCVGNNLEIYYRPGVAWSKKFILINTGNSSYKKVKDMIEILDSEYDKLEAKIKAK